MVALWIGWYTSSVLAEELLTIFILILIGGRCSPHRWNSSTCCIQRRVAFHRLQKVTIALNLSVYVRARFSVAQRCLTLIDLWSRTSWRPWERYLLVDRTITQSDALEAKTTERKKECVFFDKIEHITANYLGRNDTIMYLWHRKYAYYVIITVLIN